MPRFSLWICSLVTLLGVGDWSSARAVTVNLAAGRDNSIFSDQTGNSNGLGGSFHTGRSGGTGVRRALIYFDIASQVPAQATINSVQLSLVLTESPTQTSPDTVNVSIHRLLENWGEGTSFTGEGSGTGMGTLATVGDATWPNRFHDPIMPVSWTTAGGDFQAVASATQAINKLSATPAQNIYSWQSAAMIVDVQNWLDDSAANFGWILVGDESVTRTTRRFGSRESTIESLRPVLTIDYTPVPEPCGGVLVAVGLLGLSTMVRRFRKSR